MKILWGIHKPKPASDQKIARYYQRKDLATTNILRPKDSLAWEFVFKKFYDLPDIYLFNGRGQVLKNREAGQCNARVFDITEILCDTIEKLPQDTGFNLNSIWPLLAPISGGHLPEINDGKPVVLLFTATFGGRLNKDHVRVWENNLSHQKCSFHYFKVIEDPLKH